MSYLFSLLLALVMIFQASNIKIMAAPLLPPDDAIGFDSGVVETTHGLRTSKFQEFELGLANKFSGLQGKDISELWFYWHDASIQDAYAELNLVVYEIGDDPNSFGPLVYSQTIDTSIFTDDLKDSWFKIEFDNVFKAIHDQYYFGFYLHCIDEVSSLLDCFLVATDNDASGGHNSFWHDVQNISTLTTDGFANLSEMPSPGNYMIRIVATERPSFRIQDYSAGITTSDIENPSVGETVTLTAQFNDGYELNAFWVNGVPIAGNTFIMPDEDVFVTTQYDGIAYRITHGNGQIFTLGDTNELSFTSDGLLSLLDDVQVNYVSLDAADYEVRSGSVILTLKNSYLNSLAEGPYLLSLEYSNYSTALAGFTVVAAKEEIKDDIIIEDDEADQEEIIIEDDEDEVKGDQAESEEKTEKPLLPDMGDNNNNSILGLVFITFGILLIVKKEESLE